jgi:hypothetical protein
LKAGELLRLVTDRCPDHRTVDFVLACRRCHGQLQAQLAKRRELDQAAK